MQEGYVGGMPACRKAAEMRMLRQVAVRTQMSPYKWLGTDADNGKGV